VAPLPQAQLRSGGGREVGLDRDEIGEERSAKHVSSREAEIVLLK